MNKQKKIKAKETNQIREFLENWKRKKKGKTFD